jgi:hypothetical protein
MLNPSLVAFSLFLLRLTIYGASIGDAITLSALAALYGYNLYLSTIKTISVNDSVRKDLEEVKTMVTTLKLAKTLNR